jgi:hypothetical protein
MFYKERNTFLVALDESDAGILRGLGENGPGKLYNYCVEPNLFEYSALTVSKPWC